MNRLTGRVPVVARTIGPLGLNAVSALGAGQRGSVSLNLAHVRHIATNKRSVPCPPAKPPLAQVAWPPSEAAAPGQESEALALQLSHLRRLRSNPQHF
eukprot:2154384-Prorocentrum_lima.AAC.1